MPDYPTQRPLPPGQVLPPPQTPSGHYGHPGQPESPPAYQPSPYQPSPYQPHPYEQYSQQHWTHPSDHPQQWGATAWGPPPRRKRGLSLTTLFALGALAAVVFLLIVATSLTGRGETQEVDGPFDSGNSPFEGPEGNDDVQPGSPDAVLEANALYDEGELTEVTCRAPDLGDASTSRQTAYYERVLGCLSAAWEPEVEGAGFAYDRPGLHVYESGVTTPCGSFKPQDGRMLAFYCPADMIMYADVEAMQAGFGGVDVAYAVLVGHEFGHHVQFQTGMMEAEYRARREDPSRALDLSRRRELQASCFGGLFLGSVRETYPIDDERERQLRELAGFFGDSADTPASQRDHGSGASNRYWILNGYTVDDIAGCDVFAAPDNLTR